jgi:hypothetical protein
MKSFLVNILLFSVLWCTFSDCANKEIALEDMDISDVTIEQNLSLVTASPTNHVRLQVSGEFAGFFTIYISSPNSGYYRELHFDRSPVNWLEDMPWDLRDATVSYSPVEMKSGSIKVSAGLITK